MPPNIFFIYYQRIFKLLYKSYDKLKLFLEKREYTCLRNE